MDADTVQTLKNALTAAGIDPTSLNLTAHDDTVGYPNGSFEFRYISVNTAAGTFGLGTDLVGQSPSTAVVDIEHALGKA